MPSVDELAGLVARLEAVADRLEKGGGAGGEDAAASVSAFDSSVVPGFAEFKSLSVKIGGDVAKVGTMVEQAIAAQKAYITIASKSKQPSSTSSIQQLLKPTSDKISEIQAFREQNRRSDFFNHLSAISESIPALGWVAISPAPAPYVKEMNDAGQFYTNRVLKDWKEKDKTHVEWVKAWVAALSELQSYVKQYHTTGLVWNPKGGDAMSASGGAGAPPPPPPAGLPPPPPMPVLDTSAPSGPTARGALLDSLNKGSDITKGLKKVSKDQMTHKNPALRGEGLVKSKEPAASTPTKKFGGAAVDKPPKFELDGKKWVVEFFKKKPEPIDINDCEVNQSVYVYKCEGITVKVNGKVNNIILDSCKKVGVVYDSVVSSCEFINCQSVQMQVTGNVRTISVDKTDGCQMYLNKESLGVEIVTAKSSEMNVLIPEGEDFVEQPIPEQFKTTISGGKLTTTATESV